MTIQTTELLELFTKATKLGLSYDVMEDKDGDYSIKFCEMYTNNFSETLVINKNCDSNAWDWGKGTGSFQYLMDTFIDMLKQKEEEKLKEQKRQELFSRLTDEEKELLGVRK